jgi:hypothetical protein
VWKAGERGAKMNDRMMMRNRLGVFNGVGEIIGDKLKTLVDGDVIVEIIDIPHIVTLFRH